MAIHKIVTPKQLDANRKNARKSTGPKSVSGKRWSRSNAVKHGILSSQIVIKTGIAKEDQEEFDALLEGLRNYWQPVGLQEDLLVQEIAVENWRERRVLRSEAGMIEQRSSFVAGRHLSADDPLEELSSEISAALEELRTGDLSLDNLREISRRMPELHERISGYNALHKNDGEDRRDVTVEAKEGLEQVLVESLAAVQEQRSEIAKIKKWKAESLLRVSSLPEPDLSDALLRYDNSIHRHLDRAMAQLERLQSRRKGEAVPAPLTVSVET